MCTCIAYKNGDFYFGRNLDLEYTFGEKVVITPRNYRFSFQALPDMPRHYAMIGMASTYENYPLYAEAVNEKGLGIAGLNFPGNAVYKDEMEGKKNVAPYELIPWILGQCSTVDEARNLLEGINLLNIPFAESLPLAPLHWMIADKKSCIVLEAVEDGVHIYENKYGILTNNPPFPYYQIHLSNYRHLTGKVPENQFAEKLELPVYGQGLGGVGLPGDYSPVSRFVKAAFLKWNSYADSDELSNITQFFHILDAVSMVRGSVITEEGKFDITTYSCCVNAEKGIYYYKTYENNQIQEIVLRNENLESCKCRSFDLTRGQRIHKQN
ncbi:MAG TPA: choloylglycine hydrolase [Candidatus Blautia stercoravium]|nr:choloylglycine hydrolase [Candidatus Blautia stercoravium]